MKKPKLNENTIAKIEIFGHAECGNNYYELKDYIDAEGKCTRCLNGQTSEPEMQNNSIGKNAQKRLDKPLLFIK